MSEKKVKTDEMVQIIGNGSSKHLGEGVTKIVHQIVADKLVELGYASIGDTVTTTKRKGKKKEKLEM